MQRNDPEMPVTLEATDFEPLLGGGLTQIDAVIEVVKSDCPKEWARYCDLAHQLVQPKQPTEISQEEAARQLLARNSKRLHRKDKSHLVRFGSMPLTEIEIMEAEAQTLEGHFRDRLLWALLEGRYSLIAFDDRLKEVTVPLALIKPGHFRFESEEMEVNGIKLIGVRFVPAQAIPAYQNDPRGPKPGQQSAKRRVCEAALSILNDPAKRPARGYGRRSKIARLIYAQQAEDGPKYKVDSILRMIRGTVTDWETNNPDD